MKFEKILEEYEKLDFEKSTREELEDFRNIFLEYGELEKSLEIAKIVYEKYRDEESIIAYVDNLMNLGMTDDALLVLFEVEKTPNILFLEGLIYKTELLYDVAEEKLKKARKETDDEELKFYIDNELNYIYSEDGRVEEGLALAYKVFEKDDTLYNFKSVIDNLIISAKFEDAIDFYNDNGKKYDDAEVYFAVSFAYNQLQDLDKAKEYLIKTIEIDPEYVEAYMHLGFMTKGDEAISYFEKYLELHGMSHNVYLQLISLYAEQKNYEKIREIAQNVISEMGIDADTLYISISALRSLYEYDKIFEVYNEYDLIKTDTGLMILALLSLTEEDDYVDFVVQEIKNNHEELKEENSYIELLELAYNTSYDEKLAEYITEVNNRSVNDDIFGLI